MVKSAIYDMGSREILIEKEAKDACARLHSGIRLSVINEVDENSTEEKADNKRNKANNETANDNKEASIVGSGFSMPTPIDNCN